MSAVTTLTVEETFAWLSSDLPDCADNLDFVIDALYAQEQKDVAA